MRPSAAGVHFQVGLGIHALYADAERPTRSPHPPLPTGTSVPVLMPHPMAHVLRFMAHRRGQMVGVWRALATVLDYILKERKTTWRRSLAMKYLGAKRGSAPPGGSSSFLLRVSKLILVGNSLWHCLVHLHSGSLNRPRRTGDGLLMPRQ